MKSQPEMKKISQKGGDEYGERDNGDAENENATDGPSETQGRRSETIRRGVDERCLDDRTALVTHDGEPNTFDQNKPPPDSTSWKAAMQCEYESLLKHNTWTIVQRPADRKVVACKWV
jgi:hypothetical protein